MSGDRAAICRALAAVVRTDADAATSGAMTADLEAIWAVAYDLNGAYGTDGIGWYARDCAERGDAAGVAFWRADAERIARRQGAQS